MGAGSRSSIIPPRVRSSRRLPQSGVKRRLANNGRLLAKSLEGRLTTSSVPEALKTIGLRLASVYVRTCACDCKVCSIGKVEYHDGWCRQEGCRRRVVNKGPSLDDPSFDNPLDLIRG